MLFYLLVCVVYICIYKICCNIFAKKCLLGENVPMEWKICLLIGNVLIGRKGACWPEKCTPKGVYLKVITLHIGYTKKCLWIEKESIGWKCAYQKLFIKMSQPFILDIPKGAYWSKMCLLIEKVPIENENSQIFDIFKYIRGINLCSHMAQYEEINKKSNVLVLYWKVVIYIYSKRCLLKCYNHSNWTKMYLLNKKMSVERKCTYWTKMCLLNDHNPLGINSYRICLITSYLSSFFFSKNLFIFLKNTRNMNIL